MALSEQTVRREDLGTENDVSLDRPVNVRKLSSAATELAQLSEYVDHAEEDAGFKRKETTSPDAHDHGPDN